MCGEVPLGHTAYTQCIRLGTNQNQATVNLSQPLHNVVEIRLDMYMVRAPNGGVINPDFWRIKLGTGITSDVDTNAAGQGYPVVINNVVLTHVVFDRPRVMSRSLIKHLNLTSINITDETGAAVTFADAAFWLTFVCRDDDWSPRRIMAEHFLRAVDNIENDGRIPDEVGGTLQQLVNQLR